MNVLMLLPDLPGHFHAAARALGEAWKTEGHRVVFAVTSAYYPSFKGVDFRAVGPVADLSADRLSVQPKDDFGHWARPAIANERLQRNRAGDVVVQLKTPHQDGTTHIVMSPLKLVNDDLCRAPNVIVYDQHFCSGTCLLMATL